MRDSTETAPPDHVGGILNLEYLLDSIRTLEQTVSRQADTMRSLAQRVADLELGASTEADQEVSP